MNTEYKILLVALVLIGIGTIIGFNIGKESCSCDTNPQNIAYWQQKFYQTNESLTSCQGENSLLTSNLFNLLINSYTNKIIWSASGLGSYSIFCKLDYRDNQNIPSNLKNIINMLCNK